jgi:GH18 family chitinase
MRAHGPAASTC